MPFPELSDQPQFEVRSAVVAGIEIFYKQFYVGGAVDLIGLTPPPIGER